MEQSIKISKFDAAKRQLETAIRLFFNDIDPISIHTLAFAAYGILSNLNKHQKGTALLFDGTIFENTQIKEQDKSEFSKKINEAKNYFKHADRDPETIISFFPITNELIIYEACTVYEKLTGEKVPIFITFQAWFYVIHPNLTKGLEDKYIKAIDAMSNISKVEFYKNMLYVTNLVQ